MGEEKMCPLGKSMMAVWLLLEGISEHPNYRFHTGVQRITHAESTTENTTINYITQN